MLSELASRRGLTRTALADILLRLHVEGLLTQPLVPTVSHGQLRREIQRSVEFCGTETRTAYGPLVQTLDMDIGNEGEAEISCRQSHSCVGYYKCHGKFHTS